MPSSRIIWAAASRRDLVEIGDYIARDSRSAALRAVQRIRASAALLLTFPSSGRPGVVPGTREFPVPGLPYILVYDVMGPDIYVQRVRHGAQLYPPA